MQKNTEHNKTTAENDFQIVDGELLEVATGANLQSADEEKTLIRREAKRSENSPPKNAGSKFHLRYIFLPLIFLTVTLLGGLRLSGAANDFLFFKPALVCLILAAILLLLFFRAGLIEINRWFDEDFSPLENASNALVLLTLFAASTQIFNALLPENGLPFWIVAFCFFWTLWNNLFADFDTKRLLRSLGALFGFAFVAKYLILANIAAPANESWIKSVWENPAQEALTYLLNLPRFSAGTGYIQFFTLVFFLIGLFLFPQKPEAAVLLPRERI